MRTPKVPAPSDGLVRLPLGKGVVLVLTMSEYGRGLTRGKQERRAARLAAQVDKHHADDDAHTLDWITPREEDEDDK